MISNLKFYNAFQSSKVNTLRNQLVRAESAMSSLIFKQTFRNQITYRAWHRAPAYIRHTNRWNRCFKASRLDFQQIKANFKSGSIDCLENKRKRSKITCCHVCGCDFLSHSDRCCVLLYHGRFALYTRPIGWSYGDDGFRCDCYACDLLCDACCFAAISWKIRTKKSIYK